MDGANGVPPLTASIGIAHFGTGHRLSYESVLARADVALYAAKDSGRDAVRSFAPGTPDPGAEAPATTAAGGR
jgi:GGDEF domain-containing protein